MNKFFAIVGGCVVLILTALFAVPAVIDWSRYRTTFEEQATRLLARPVRVGEHVRVQLLPSPAVSFENVRIADASGHFDTPLLRAESFHMQLAIGALLTGSLVAQDIEMTNPSLRLSIGSDGKGNWAGLGANAGNSVAGELPGLALNAVHIDHGTLELVDSGGGRARLGDITGDFDAPALTGPYHFRGEADTGGNPAEIRFSAGQEGADPATRLRLAWRQTAGTAANYTLDGKIEGLQAMPRFAGTLAMLLPKAAAASGGTRPPLDLKAGIDITTDRATLHDIEMVFDDAARPQQMTGSAVLDWRDPSASVVNLSAVWLDLDKIAGADASGGPLAAVRKLIGLVAGTWPAPGRAKLRMQAGEAAIGGGTVRDLKLEAGATDEGLAIASLTGRLPGLGRIDLSGKLGEASADRFAGNVRLWGANLAALVNWALPGAGLPDKGATSPYLIDGAITAAPERFQADNLRLEISGTTVTGSVAYSGAESRSLSVSLDSGRLDLTQLLDAPIAGSLLSAAIAPAQPRQGDATAADDAVATLRAMLSGETHFDLRLGHLITALGTLKDVSARIDRSNDRLAIPGIDLTTAAGSALHLDGALQARGDAGLGQLRLTMSVPNPDAVSEGIRLIGLAKPPAAAQSAMAAMTPLRLAGTVQLGGAGGASEHLQLDGLANGSRLMLRLERDGADNDWLGSPLDIAAELANADVTRLLAQVTAALNASPVAPAGTGTAANKPAAAGDIQPGKLTLRLSGVPRQGVLTSAALASQAVRARFDGRAVLADGGLGMTGAVSLDAPNGISALALARLDKFVPAFEGPLALTAKTSLDGGTIALSDAKATFAGQTIVGSAQLSGAKQPAQLTANLTASTLRLDQILAKLTPGEPLSVAGQSAGTPATTGQIGAVSAGAATGAAAQGTIAQVASSWSTRPIDFTLLDRLEAKIDASAAKLVLPDGTTVENAQANLSSTPASLDVTLSQGVLAGGVVAGHGRLAKDAAGMLLQLEGTVKNATLEGLAGGSAGVPPTGLPLPKGRLTLSGHLESHGLSPADLAAGAVGSGEFAIGEGGIAGVSPLAVDAVARDVLGDPSAAVSEADLKLRLDKARGLAPFPTLGVHAGFVVGGGSLRFDGLLVKSSKSELEIGNRIDLVTMRLASVWTLKPKPPQADAPSLAPVQFTFEGLLHGFAATPAAIDVAALARDLTNRKLLGSPQQMQGIWPESTPSPTLSPGASNAKPPVAAPRPVTPLAAPAPNPPAVGPAKSASRTDADPVVAAAPASGSATGAAFIVAEPPPASVPVGVDPSTIATALDRNPDAAAPGAAPASSAAGLGAGANAHARRKKSDWTAALFQSLFGN